MMKLKNVIILNRMYVGSYLDDNIGHEVINLLKDDNGDNYIYVNPHGSINPKYNDAVRAVILVKHIEKGVMEIIAKAEKLEQVAYQSRLSGECGLKEEGAQQIEYIKGNDVRFGGALLHEIYDDIDLGGKAITFKAGTLKRPRVPLYLIEEKAKIKEYKNSVFLPEKHFSNQSLKMYYDEAKLPKDYKVLARILEDASLWERVNSTETLDASGHSSIMMRNNFVSIIRKENDELVYSNLLAHFFEANSKLFSAFAKEVLSIEDFNDNFDIVRESNENIDIWIENDDEVIIIENKIKSKINGERHDIYSNKIQSQLSKYYKYAHRECPGKNIYCYIFSPDYNNIDLSKYATGKQYTVINYSKIYEFYKKHAGSMIHAKYFPEFLDALYLFTGD